MQVRFLQSLVKLRPQIVRVNRSMMSERAIQSLQKLQSASDTVDAKLFSMTLKSYCSENHPEDIIQKIIPMMNDELVSNLDNSTIAETVWGLGKLGLDSTKSSDVDLCQGILVQLYKSENLSASQINATLSGIMEFNYTWETLPIEFRENILLKVFGVCNEFNARQLSNVLNSLSKMDMLWSDLPPELQSLMEESILRQSHDFNSLGGVMLLLALGRMNFNINGCDQILSNKLCAVVERILGEQLRLPNRDLSRDLLGVFRGMANIGARFSALSPSLQRDFGLAVDGLLLDTDGGAKSQCIMAMGRMGFTWAGLGYDSRKVLKTVLAEDLVKMNSQGASSTLIGVAHMGLKLIELSPAVKSAVEAAVVMVMTVRPGVVTTTHSLEALALIGFQWSDLTPQLKECISTVLSVNFKDLDEVYLPRLQDSLDAMGAGR